MLPRTRCCCGLACACGVRVLWLHRSVPRNREIWGASFVFWPGIADCVDVCSGEADSHWRALSVVCPTGDKWCAVDLCDRILGVTLPYVELQWWRRQVPDSKVHGANMGPILGRQDPGWPHGCPMNFAIWGVCVCVAKIIGRTKEGCQLWVGNCVKRRGEFLDQ